VFAYVRLQDMFAKMFASRQISGRFARFLNYGMFARVREQANICALFPCVRRQGALLCSGAPRRGHKPQLTGWSNALPRRTS
jgi:hypothetical protein